MSEDFGSLSSDFYVNQRLNLKMDLPGERETLLAMFDRVRREFPGMTKFRRLAAELALETESREGQQQWVTLRRTSIRSGVVNPSAPAEAYRIHRHILEIAPYFLSISPLDVDYLELLFGFDLLAQGNHDAIVYDALYAGTSLGNMLDIRGASSVDCQPVFSIALTESADIQATFEVKTRTPMRGIPGAKAADYPPEPISVYLTLRRHGSVNEITELADIMTNLSQRAEELLESRVIPSLIVPIRDAIASNNS